MAAASDLLRAARVLVAVALVIVGAAACEPQVEIILLRGEDLEAAPEFVRFEFADLDANELERFGPYAVTGLPNDELARVPPDHTFVIGVIGCKSAEEEGCLDPDEFLAQGCSDEQRLGRGESATIEITVHSAETGAELCGITEIAE